MRWIKTIRTSYARKDKQVHVRMYVCVLTIDWLAIIRNMMLMIQETIDFFPQLFSSLKIFNVELTRVIATVEQDFRTKDFNNFFSSFSLTELM